MLKFLKEYQHFEENFIDDTLNFMELPLEEFELMFEQEYLEQAGNSIESETVLSNNTYVKTDNSFIIYHLDHDDVHNKILSSLVVFVFNYIDEIVNFSYYIVISKNKKDIEYLLSNNSDVKHLKYKEIKKVKSFSELVYAFIDVINYMYEVQVDVAHEINKIMRGAKFKVRKLLDKQKGLL